MQLMFMSDGSLVIDIFDAFTSFELAKRTYGL